MSNHEAVDTIDIESNRCTVIENRGQRTAKVIPKNSHRGTVKS